MYLFQSYSKQISTISLVIIFTLVIPLQAFAQGTPATTLAETNTAVTTSEQTTSETSHPTGVAAKTYRLNESTGLWENDHYTWNPVTKETRAKVAPEYTYNAETGLYDTRVWEYVPASGIYVLTDESVANPPAGAIRHGEPAPLSATVADGTPIPVHALPDTADTTDPTPSLTADQSKELQTITSDATVLLNTVVDSSATSGNTLLQGNGNAGNATSGDASATATVINLLQSSSSLAGNGVAVFSTDIQGDVGGDLLIDPASFMNQAGVTNSDLNTLNNLDVNSRTDGVIQNDINLEATSGNASIIDNTSAGNATTGNATAVANVLNLINSVVAANQSFIGTINIYGNFRGDILVPTDSLHALLAGNGSGQATTDTSTETNLSLTDNQQIVNNIDLAAASGNTEVSGNRQVGNVTSGNALTRLTILNLTGKQVNAANSLLVFVNVLGTWVGLIMDAPAGTTAAALGGGVTASTNSATDTTDITVETDSSIINNITAHAQSGDTSVVNNTRVGDVKTGAAKASANIVNFIGSQFNLSHWFGVLFINVFGSWHGNFGTARTPDPVAAGSTGVSGNGTGQDTGSTGDQSPSLFSFKPAGAGAIKSGLGAVSPASFTSPAEYAEFIDEVNGVLSANDETIKTIVTKNKPSTGATGQSQFSLAALPLVLGFAGLSIVGTERVRAIRNKMRLQHYYRR